MSSLSFVSTLLTTNGEELGVGCFWQSVFSPLSHFDWAVFSLIFESFLCILAVIFYHIFVLQTYIRPVCGWSYFLNSGF